MNILLSYCGLSDSRIRASEKDLPVTTKMSEVFYWFFFFLQSTDLVSLVKKLSLLEKQNCNFLIQYTEHAADDGQLKKELPLLRNEQQNSIALN